MAVKNQLAKPNQKIGLTAYLTKDAVKDQINKVVGGKDRQRFISAIISATNTNPALQECTNQSILSGALLGESLKLSPSPQLGHYYLVPYGKENPVAQFQLGYKGYIQLAIRSGQYKKLNVMAIKEGELEYFDPLNEDIKINLQIEDWDARENTPTIGYYAFFELTNGFRKALYWSKAQMEVHAMKYSPGYRAKKGYTFWEKDFDGMAYKTMLRQLISKWGIMSIEMQNAFEGDMAIINEDGSKNYVETEDDNIINAEVVEATIVDEQPQVTIEKTEDSVNGNVNEQPQDVANTLFG